MTIHTAKTTDHHDAFLTTRAISIILPAFNEAETISLTVSRIAHVLEKLSPHWDIVVIDDGSRDDTAAIVRTLPKEFNTTLVRFSRNFGKEHAITAGLAHATGDIVICMDADGQHSSDLIASMITQWKLGYNMVYAVLKDRQSESSFKRIGSKLFYSVISLGGKIHIPRDAGDFRLMDRQVVNAILMLPERDRFMKGIYAWVGYQSIGIPYTPLPREHGKTNYSKLKLIQLAWTGVTSFSVMPLRIASATGALLAFIAFVYGVFVAIDHLFFNESVPGWPTVVVSMMFFAGVQLLFIGILGEYLARIYDEVKGRPPYVIAEVAGAKAAQLSEKNSAKVHNQLV